MSIVKTLAEHLDTSEYEVFQMAAYNHKDSKYINAVTDFTLYCRRGFIPPYIYGYDRRIRCPLLD